MSSSTAIQEVVPSVGDRGAIPLCQAGAQALEHLPPLDVGCPQLLSSAACEVLTKSLAAYKMIFQPHGSDLAQWAG